MKNFKYILTSAAIFASLINPTFASESSNDDIKNEVVCYDKSSLDDLLKENLETKAADDKLLDETELKAKNYKGSNEVEVKEDSKSEEPKEKEAINEDVVEITGSNANGNGTDQEPGTVRFTNYRPGILYDFDIRTKNPDHMTGEYIDKFLEKRTHYTPLKGYGDVILKYSKKYGINVGIFMGQIAKETTFGMNAAGGKYNFGAVRYYKNGAGSEYPPAYIRGSAWINPPTVESGIEILFKL